MPLLQQQFPSLYTDLLPELMQMQVPQEVKADCSNCGMIQRDPSLGASQKHLFRADTKCCTYQPRLPNYLVGGLLQDQRPALAEGQARMRASIQARIGVTPWSISPSLLSQHLYKHAKSSFGKSARLRCPYYASEKGQCTIWAYRETVCSTWYCKYDAGKDGLLFWTSIKRYMSFVEKQLSRYAMLQVDAEMVLDDQAAAYYDEEDLTQEQLDELPPDPALYARLWRSFEGKEELFYQRCYEIVRDLAPDEVQRLLGLDGQIKGLDTQRKHASAHSESVPEHLSFNPQVTMQWLASGEIALSSYSEYDALALPGEVYPLLVAFDGRQSTAATREKIREQYQSDLSEEILMTLYRHRILH